MTLTVILYVIYKQHLEYNTIILASNIVPTLQQELDFGKYDPPHKTEPLFITRY